MLSNRSVCLLLLLTAGARLALAAGWHTGAFALAVNAVGVGALAVWGRMNRAARFRVYRALALLLQMVAGFLGFAFTLLPIAADPIPSLTYAEKAAAASRLSNLMLLGLCLWGVVFLLARWRRYLSEVE